MKLLILALGLFVLGLSLASAGQMLSSGDEFPAWRLTDQNGKALSSADLAGKTYLLWFYPKAMTSGCTKEGCALRDRYEGFREAGVEVIGVSFDSPDVNREFAAQQGFPFRLLSDTERKLAVAVGAADSAESRAARRVSYLVGSDGTVLKAYDKVDPATHAEQVLADVKALHASS